MMTVTMTTTMTATMIMMVLVMVMMMMVMMMMMMIVIIAMNDVYEFVMLLSLLSRWTQDHQRIVKSHHVGAVQPQMWLLLMQLLMIIVSVPAKQQLSTAAIKMETNHYLLLFVVVNGHFFHFDFPVSPES